MEDELARLRVLGDVGGQADGGRALPGRVLAARHQAVHVLQQLRLAGARVAAQQDVQVGPERQRWEGMEGGGGGMGRRREDVYVEAGDYHVLGRAGNYEKIQTRMTGINSISTQFFFDVWATNFPVGPLSLHVRENTGGYDAILENYLFL